MEVLYPSSRSTLPTSFPPCFLLQILNSTRNPESHTSPMFGDIQPLCVAGTIYTELHWMSLVFFHTVVTYEVWERCFFFSALAGKMRLKLLWSRPRYDSHNVFDSLDETIHQFPEALSFNQHWPFCRSPASSPAIPLGLDKQHKISGGTNVSLACKITILLSATHAQYGTIVQLHRSSAARFRRHTTNVCYWTELVGSQIAM